MPSGIQQRRGHLRLQWHLVSSAFRLQCVAQRLDTGAPPLDAMSFDLSPYRSTPAIIEAAQGVPPYGVSRSAARCSRSPAERTIAATVSRVRLVRADQRAEFRRERADGFRFRCTTPRRRQELVGTWPPPGGEELHPDLPRHYLGQQGRHSVANHALDIAAASDQAHIIREGL